MSGKRFLQFGQGAFASAVSMTRRLAPRDQHHGRTYANAHKSFSQFGQDVFARAVLITRHLVPREPDYVGTYVDVGACWPSDGSNTYLFYTLGWRGICIDANPEMTGLFAKERPEDKFVNSGVGNEPGKLTYFMYDNAQHNSFNPGRAAKAPEKVVRKLDIDIRRLSDIIDENMDAGRSIDFMSMDIEGFEMEALASLDLKRHGPKLIAIEAIADIDRVKRCKHIKFLLDRNYELIAHTGHDAFLIKK